MIATEESDVAVPPSEGFAQLEDENDDDESPEDSKLAKSENTHETEMTLEEKHAQQHREFQARLAKRELEQQKKFKIKEQAPEAAPV